jgi:aspartate 1-decarboxylase
MFRTFCRAKIANATITRVELLYGGSITIPPDVMKVSDILAGERAQVVNANNGDRFDTYVIEGEKGSHDIVLNGPAARRGMVGDRIMILAYAIGERSEVKSPAMIYLDEKNKPIKGK